MPKLSKPTTIAEKVTHVKRAGQTRDHVCHWPGCGKQVPPAMWGCAAHWKRLPKSLRDRIWATYQVGQEVNMTPSHEYLEVTTAVQEWIYSQENDNGEKRREKLAVNIADLTRLDDLMRGILLSGKLAEKHVITDKGRADEAAVELICPLLTAATTLDMIRSHDRRLKQHPTRVYLRRAVAWNKLPGDAVLSVVDDRVRLNPAIFPPTGDEAEPLAPVKPAPPRSVKTLV